MATDAEINEAVAQKEKFWKRVNKTDSCWLWTGNKIRNGYGMFYTKNHERYLAHRYAFFLWYGRHPDKDKVIMHLCDVKACVNPGHLKMATQSENLQDMVNKDRRLLKLTTHQVKQIKTLRGCGLSLSQLGRNFGVDKTTIWKIFKGEIWTKIEA